MIIENKVFDEERALYGLKDAEIKNCKIDGPADGESALKECDRISVDGCYFNLRYPFWHTDNTVIKNSEMTSLCRAALWYNKNIQIIDSKLNGIKALRESKEISLKGCEADSPEFLWRCSDIKIDNCKITSEYPFFESRNIDIKQLNMKGKYSFQYVEDVEINDSYLDTKDAFWHSKNVTVCDSVVKGEYLGWYSENLRLIRCKIIGTQPLCYCKGLYIEDCTMEDTDLSFERSEVNATVNGEIDSVKNPVSGSITADGIKEIILESEYIDPSKTVITIRNK